MPIRRQRLPRGRPKIEKEELSARLRPLAQAYRRLFVNRTDFYARQSADGRYFLVRKPLSSWHLLHHFQGDFTLGLYAPSESGTTRWACLDTDAEDGLEQLRKVALTLRERGVAACLEASRRGGHLWVFLEPVPVRMARALLQEMARLAGVSGQVFPSSEHGLSLMRAPLGIHRKSGERYPFLDSETLKPVARDLKGQLAYVKGFRRLSRAKLMTLLAQLFSEHQRPEFIALSVPPGRGRRASQRAARLLAAVGVESIVSLTTRLDRRGRGACPLHSPDPHRALAINRQHHTWCCFHQLLGGDPIALYARVKNMDYNQAVKVLCERFRIP